MTEKLELKHLAPYLAEELHIQCKGGRFIMDADGQTEFNALCSPFISINAVLEVDSRKPILRPLSDLTKVRDNGKTLLADLKWKHPHFEYMIQGNELDIKPKTGSNPTHIRLIGVMNFLFKHHFDVDRLIEKGLAVDVNTLEK